MRDFFPYFHCCEIGGFSLCLESHYQIDNMKFSSEIGNTYSFLLHILLNYFQYSQLYTV